MHDDAAALREQLIRQDFIVVTSTDAGKRVIARLIELTRPRADPFVQGASDTTAYMIGMQRVGCAIADMLREIDPRLAGECYAALVEFEKGFPEEDMTER